MNRSGSPDRDPTDRIVCEVEDADVLTLATDGDGGGSGVVAGGAPAVFKLGGRVQTAEEVTVMSMVSSEVALVVPTAAAMTSRARKPAELRR